MLSRVIVKSARPLRSSLQSPTTCLQRRWASAEVRPEHTNFYKTFGRPVSKCILIAVFTYQVVYWSWLKLEQDEIREERTAEISDLEAQVKSLQAAAKKA